MSGAEFWLNELVWALNHICSYGVLVPFGLGLRAWRRLSPPARALVVYFGFWSFEAFLDQWSRRVLHTNMYTYHLTVLVETWLLGWAYYAVLRAPAVRRGLPPALLVFTAVCLLDAFVWSGLHNFNNYARAAQVVLIMSCVLLYFEQSVRSVKVQLWGDFMFVVSVAQAIYYAGSLMSYLVFQTLDGMAVSINGLIIAVPLLVALAMMTWALWRETHELGYWPMASFSKWLRKP